MVRQSKSVAASATPAVPAVTVVVESAPAVAPVAEKKAKKAKVAAPVVEVAAPAPAPVTDAPSTGLPSEVPIDVATLSSKLGDFSSKIQQVAALLTPTEALIF